MPTLAATRRALPAALLSLALTASASAQTAPTPPPAAPAAPDAPAAVPATPPPSAPAEVEVWRPPPPLPEGVRVPRPPPRARDIERDDALAPPRECADPQRVGRIVAETAAGAVLTAATVFVGVFAQESTSSEGTVLGTLGALVMHVIVTPAAIGLAGRSFGGNGRYWAALLGNVLVPVAGGVLGYELSHTPSCLDDAVTAPRTARRIPLTPPVRFAPVVAPNLAGTAGATAGVAITF